MLEVIFLIGDTDLFPEIGLAFRVEVPTMSEKLPL